MLLTMLVVIGLGIVGVVVAMVASRQRSDQPHADLGAVSSQWISEHRMHGSDQRR